jgi:hypothetical protein
MKKHLFNDPMIGVKEKRKNSGLHFHIDNIDDGEKRWSGYCHGWSLSLLSFLAKFAAQTIPKRLARNHLKQSKN